MASPPATTNAFSNNSPPNPGQFSELHAAVAAAGLPPMTIKTQEQADFVRSILATRSQPNQGGEAPFSTGLQKFPAVVRARLGAEAEAKLNECVGRILDGDAGEDQWDRAREEGRALLCGEGDLEAMYDRLFENPNSVNLARELKTAALKGGQAHPN